MAKSDTDECCDSPPGGFNVKMLEETHFDKANDTTIHSGHFMVSFVHDDTEADGEEEQEETSLPEKEPEPGYDFVTATKETSSSYQFGNKCTQTVAIDASLTKLFDCMTLAYSGKLTSPKWKNFKGIKLRLKDKVRMNNMIWREWHMQFIQGKLPIICQFEPPISDRTHTKPEAVVLEGKYWKRRLESVTAEYKKWRLFFRERAMGIGSEDNHLMQEVASHAELLERVAQHDFFKFSQQQMVGQALTDHNIPDDPDDLMDFSDTLFTTFNQPFAFPNPKEMSQLGNADIIQPGLVQLQPSFDECMDTLEPLPSLQEMMGFLPGKSNNMVNNFSPLVETSRHNSQQADISMQLDGNTFDSSNAYLSNSIQSNRNLDYSQSLIDSSNSHQTMVEGPQQPVQPQVVSNSNFAADSNDASAQIINLVFTGLSQPGTTTIPIQQQPITLVSQGQNQQIQHTQLSNIGVAGPQNISGTVTIIPNQSQLQTLLQGISQNSPVLSQTITQTPQTQIDTSKHSESLIRPATYPKLQTGTPSRVKTEREGHRRGSTGSITNNNTTLRKKDGDFLVPQTTVPRSKQRHIAPAPVAQVAPVMGKPSVAETNTFLAQLLTTGTVKGNYPGTHGLAPLKEEVIKEKPEYNQLPTIATNPSSPPNFNFTGVTNTTVNDFQKNVLIAAASHALGTNVKVTDAISSAANLSAGSSPTASPGSPHIIGSPGSEGSPSGKGKKVKLEQDKQQYKESRRVNHISAEQKRRCNIKSGFDTLHQLVPSLCANPNAKISKAATLQKGAEYCRKLKEERAKMQEESEILRKEIEALNHSISMCQSQLPATGVPVTRQRVDQMKDMFDGYVRERTLGNWKFWIFSIIIRPLFDSFNSMVSTASVDELCRTVLTWLQQHCSLPILRPAVLNSLTLLSTTTSILSDPASVPEQAKLAVTKKSPKENKS